MPDAIILTGNADRFRTHTSELRGFLRRNDLVSSRRIRSMDTTHLYDGIVEYRLERANLERTRRPLLIAYVGHGGSEGWWFDDARVFSYARLAKILASGGRRPVVILNDTCSAYSAVMPLIEQGVSPERVSLIAACGVNLVTFNGLAVEASQAWEERRAIDYPGMVRWGANHDHLYHPEYVEVPIAEYDGSFEVEEADPPF